jgi:hypothetical protein
VNVERLIDAAAKMQKGQRVFVRDVNWRPHAAARHRAFHRWTGR